MQLSTRTAARATGIALLIAGGLAAPTLTAGSAQAVNPTCASLSGTITATGTTPTPACDVTGTLSLTGGGLTAALPTALAWSKTLDGTDAQVVDTTHQSMEVDDLTGTGLGWHLTVAATTFTNTVDATKKLADTGTLKFNGSTTDNASTAAPTAACVATTTCTLPTTGTVASYPVTITTAASSPTAKTIYSAGASSGIGKIALSNLGWWIAVPAKTLAGTYTSTVTVSIVSAP